MKLIFVLMSSCSGTGVEITEVDQFYTRNTVEITKVGVLLKVPILL